MIKIVLIFLLLCSQVSARMCPSNVGGAGGDAGEGGSDPCDTEVQSCITTDNSTDSNVGATYRWKASKFVAGDTATICSVKIRLKKSGNPSFNITASIYGSTGTEPDESNIIGTSDSISALNDVTTSFAYVEFPGISASISNTTEYWLVVTTSALGDASNYLIISTDPGCDYEDGIKYSSNGTSWTGSDSSRGFKYYLYE